jgi:hypothetical protein
LSIYYCSYSAERSKYRFEITYLPARLRNLFSLLFPNGWSCAGFFYRDAASMALNAIMSILESLLSTRLREQLEWNVVVPAARLLHEPHPVLHLFFHPALRLTFHRGFPSQYFHVF